MMRGSERGQAALTLVLAITMLLVTCGGILAANSIAHDPLVQTDAVEHYAYRALEAGVNSYLATINAQPDLVDCSSDSVASTCTNSVNGIRYDSWAQVPDTTQAAGNVPEYYLWSNPQLCFSQSKSTETTCTADPTSSDGNFEYLQVEIVGAAGYPGRFLYQSSVANFSAGQGFLTRVWWSDYEATDLRVQDPTTQCHLDWTDPANPTDIYRGDGSCGPVDFGPGDVVDGPIYTNDSIYVATSPVFGTPTTSSVNSPVETADPNCLFVDPGTSGTSTETEKHCAQVEKTDVGRYTHANSHDKQKKQQIPTKDTTLETLASLDGCVYTGPTLISFFAKDDAQYMDVFSPETPVATGRDLDDASTDTRSCAGAHTTPPSTWTTLPAPTSAQTGNGVIYVATTTKGTDGAGSCKGDGDSPFDGTIQHRVKSAVPTYATTTHPTTVKAQVVAKTEFAGTRGYTYVPGETAGTDDCAGDVFVRDAVKYPTGAVPGIAGNLTVAAQHNVVVTGDLEYTDCGTAFASNGYRHTCRYAPGAVNDSFGLIATDFVDVSRPVVPCRMTHHGYYGYYGRTSPQKTVLTCGGTATSTLAHCPATVSTLTAVLCNPGPTVVIDAAVLALKQSFTVDNYSVGSATDRLNIYGSVDQKFRGPVGTFSGDRISTGYSKYYVWDSRLQYVSIPHYLTPDTPSWLLSSSSVSMSTACPGWPKPYPTGSTPAKPLATRLIPAATSSGPTGAAGAC